MVMTKKSLLEITSDEVAQLMTDLSQPKFRSKQLLEWIFAKRAASFDDMKNLPAALREKLSGNFVLRNFKVNTHQVSDDGLTEKWLLENTEKQGLECVLIKEGPRRTACVSCALGCPLNCKFCASAKGGFVRNLTAAEIVEQVVQIENITGERVSNVVFMGTGEPFLNYDNVMQAARIMNSPEGLGIGARHITISTSGVITGIERFAAEPEDFRLAISLHAPNQKAREKIIPSAQKWKLNRLISVIRRYNRTTRREVTFEYILIDGFNCHPNDARELCELIKGIPCKINCIPYNSTGFAEDSEWTCPGKDTCRDFVNIIRETGIRVTLRQEKGTDISAACGQLRAHKLLRNDKNKK